MTHWKIETEKEEMREIIETFAGYIESDDYDDIQKVEQMMARTIRILIMGETVDR